MFRTINAVLLSCAITTSLIAADNAVPAKNTVPLLTDYRLTWDINSADWGWNIDSNVDIEEVRRFTSSIASVSTNEEGYSGHVKISGEVAGEVKGGLALLGVSHLSIKGSSKMNFDKDRSSLLNNTSRTELKSIAEAINIYSKRIHLSKLHLSFTVTFFNLMEDDVSLSCKSIPVRCGGEHFVDASPTQGREAIIIPGGRQEGIDVMFRAELDTTKALSLINAMQDNNLEINILRGQMKALAKDGTDLISDTSRKSAQTTRLDICTPDSNKSILSWRVSNGNELKNTAPLKTVLEAINQKQSDDNGAPLFKIDGNKVSGVGIVPVIGDKAILLAISENKTELLSDLDLSKPMQGDLTILYMLTSDYNTEKTFKKYITSNVVAGLLKLAENNNKYAQVVLGVCYVKGHVVAKDEAEAVKWYRKAAEQGDAMGQGALGGCYLAGIGIAKDGTEAVKWSSKSAEQGCTPGQVLLGMCYFHGLGVPKDEVEAVKWFQKAGEQGDALGQCMLGICYAAGLGVDKDEAEATKWYRKSAEQEFAMAQYQLGLCYLQGLGVPTDDAEAVKWFQKAGEQGEPDAQCLIGECYATGHIVAKNETEAVKWYRKSAEQGNADAQAELGSCYFQGLGVPKNEEEGVKWFRKSAEQGDADAQVWLGSCYFQGVGVPKNEEEGVKWYRKSAEQGNALGQALLGDHYATAKDMGNAAEWYRKAAEQGNTNAQASLGACYFQGLGVPKNEAEGVKWYRKSAEQGNEYAQEALKSLSK